MLAFQTKLTIKINLKINLCNLDYEESFAHVSEDESEAKARDNTDTHP